MKDRAVFVLAGGQSTRMTTGVSKLLMPLGGRFLLDYALDLAHHYASEVYTVLSSALADKFQRTGHIVIQEQAKGTGDAFICAFRCALARDPDFLSKEILVILGDTPLLEMHDLEPLMHIPLRHSASMAILGMEPPDPTGYGRLLMEGEHVRAIREEKEASTSEKAIQLCNTGVMRIHAAHAHQLIEKLFSGARSEIYLTDLVEYSDDCRMVKAPWAHCVGVNTPQEWVKAEQALQQRFRQRALHQGAILIAPEQTFFSYDTMLSRGALIYPFVYCGPGVKLGCSTIFSFSHLQHCQIHDGAQVGPFAHIREGTIIGPHSQIGNFVETKNSTFEEHSKAKHLSYIGDAMVGAHVNIGAGVITCNYDGLEKHKTHIAEHAFVGSHTCLIAPVSVGAQSTVGAGSVITKDVPPQHLALSRVAQENRPLPHGSKHLRRVLKKTK